MDNLARLVVLNRTKSLGYRSQIWDGLARFLVLVLDRLAGLGVLCLGFGDPARMSADLKIHRTRGTVPLPWISMSYNVWSKK